MIAAGTSVFWSQTNYSGNVVRVVKARTMGEPFRILRSDMQEIELVKLDCMRLVPTSRLSLMDPGIVVERPARETKSERQGVSPLSRSQSDDAKVAAVSSQPKAVTTKNPRSAKSNESQESRRADSQPLATVPCGVLAFDFMNLFVRAWHAGKPTETHAIKSMFQTIGLAVRALRPERIVFAMDGGHVHRTKLLPQYKAHRTPHPPELVEQRRLAEECIRIARLPAYRVDGWEADDVLASLVDRCEALVICSSDKDLLALHGRCRIYHPWSGGGFVDPETKLGLPAGQVADYLALCGDTSDGVPGVNGIGPKTAAALLEKHGSLEAILVAAQRQLIPGAAGQRLREQRSIALTCREVVQLRESLPLSELRPWTPPVGFQQKLQAIGLGSVAAILDGLVSIIKPAERLEKHPTEATSPFLSASAGQEEQEGRDEFLPDQQELQPDQPSRECEQVSACPAQPVVPAEPTDLQPVSAGQVGGSAGWVYRSISEPIRLGITMDERWNGPDCGLISCWECGREAAGTDTENGWKRGTSNHVAWKQGFHGFDLSVQIGTKATVPETTPAVESRRRTAGSLF